MRGHLELIALRRRGYRPPLGALVQVFDDYGRERFEDPVVDEHAARIEVDKRDDPARLDLRCFIGLRVLIVGEPHHAKRCEAWGEAIRDAGASEVLAGYHDRRHGFTKTFAHNDWLRNVAGNRPRSGPG
jgi:hypothetical protein